LFDEFIQRASKCLSSLFFSSRTSVSRFSSSSNYANKGNEERRENMKARRTKKMVKKENKR
jgi:hypothetical protein